MPTTGWRDEWVQFRQFCAPLPWAVRQRSAGSQLRL